MCRNLLRISPKSIPPCQKINYKMWTYTGTIAFTAPEVFEEIEYTYNTLTITKLI